MTGRLARPNAIRNLSAGAGARVTATGLNTRAPLRRQVFSLGGGESIGHRRFTMTQSGWSRPVGMRISGRLSSTISSSHGSMPGRVCIPFNLEKDAKGGAETGIPVAIEHLRDGDRNRSMCRRTCGIYVFPLAEARTELQVGRAISDWRIPPVLNELRGVSCQGAPLPRNLNRDVRIH